MHLHPHWSIPSSSALNFPALILPHPVCLKTFRIVLFLYVEHLSIYFYQKKIIFEKSLCGNISDALKVFDMYKWPVMHLLRRIRLPVPLCEIRFFVHLPE